MMIRFITIIAIAGLATGASIAEAQCSSRSQGLHGDPKAKAGFSLSISEPEPQIKEGNPVNVMMVYTNITDHLIVMGALALDDSRSIECFEIFNSTGKLVASRMLRDVKEMKPEDADVGSVPGKFIGPGESHKSPIDLSKYYHLEQAGTYAVQFHRWSWEGNVWVNSNRIIIVIVP